MALDHWDLNQFGTEPEGVEPPTPNLKSFFVTFGIMYAHERHPYWADAHPDGWLLVLAPDEEAARLLLRRTISNKYAFIYPEDRFKREYHPAGELGRIAAASGVDGIITSSPALADKFGPSDCRYYGVDTNEVVGARIEGILSSGSDADCIEKLGYEVELVHKRCLTEGLALFATVYEVDSRVMAGELDYADPHECPVCNTSIT